VCGEFSKEGKGDVRGFCGGTGGWRGKVPKRGRGNGRKKRKEKTEGKKNVNKGPPPYGETNRPFLSLANRNGEANKKTISSSEPFSLLSSLFPGMVPGI